MTARDVHRYASDLWEAARPLRKKTLLFWLLYFKRLSDLWGQQRDTRAADARGRARENASPEKPRVVIPGNCSWSDVRNRTRDIAAGLTAAFQAIEDANPPLTGLFSALDLADAEAFPDSILHPLVAGFDALPLRPPEVDEAAFGRLCEELAEKLSQEARASGPCPSAPRQVTRLLVEILQPREGMSIYDGACGSGRTLLECAAHLRRLGKNHASLRLYGQEIDPHAAALCRIVLRCHGIEDARIEEGDTLVSPRLRTGDGQGLMTFDRVISHPPLGRKEWGVDSWSPGDPYGRSRYGLPPRYCGELAFLEHSIASLNDKGMLGVVASPGMLFRAREEGEIRKRILQDDLVEAVIGIAPEPSSSSPVCVLILNRAKPRERREKILFVNGEGEPAGASGNGLSEAAIGHIASAFDSYKDQEHVCRVVPLAEIERNNSTLSVRRYVQSGSEEPPTDLAAEWQVFLGLIAERNEAERTMAEQIDRLQDDPDDS